MYTTIYISEDGDISLEVMSRQKLIEELNDNAWGRVEFLTDPDVVDLQTTPGLYIISGAPVTPIPKRETIVYDLP